MTTIEAMKQALKVCIEMGRFGDVAAVEKADATNAVLRESIKREEAQTVEPDHIADPRKMVLGDREALISAMRMYKAAYPESKHFGKVADMLAADELEIEATTRQVEILSDELSKCSKLTQQVAVPKGWGDAVNLANNVIIHELPTLTPKGIKALAKAIILADGAMLAAAPKPPLRKSGDAHEIWAAAQLTPGEGIADGVARVEALPDAPRVPMTDDEIVKIAISSRGAEPGRDGYILPLKFARAVLAAQRGKA